MSGWLWIGLWCAGWSWVRWWLLLSLGAQNLLVGGWMEGPDAKTADRLVAARAGKSHWLVTVLGRCEAPINHRGDWGAVCRHEPESGGENPG